MIKINTNKAKSVKVQKPVEEKKDTSKKKDSGAKKYVNLLDKPYELTLSDTAKLVITVSTSGEGDPHLDIRTYINSDKYKGPTQKGINMNIELLDELIDTLTAVNEECAKNNI